MVIYDFHQREPVRGPTGATLVVGSGAAGLGLALHLADLGHEVLMVESGGFPDDDDDRLAHDHLNEGEAAGGPTTTRLVEGRARGLGGAAQLWHGQCMRLHPLDLRERVWVPHSGWPLSLEDLDPHYDAAERWLGLSGLGYDARRWSEHPRLDPLDWDGQHLLHDFTEYVHRPLLGTEQHRQLAAHPRVTTVLHATATAVHVDGGRATGVDVVGDDGRAQHLEARRVVLAAGAIENARLLQLSDPAGVGLGAGREHTGRYLQDHPVVFTADVLPRDHRVLQDRYIALHRGRRRLFPKVRLSPAAQERHGLLDATAVFVHDHDDAPMAAAHRLAVALRTRRVPARLAGEVGLALRAPRSLARDVYRRYGRGLATGARPSRVRLQVWLEQAPDPDSRVTLGSSTDALGLRRARVDWRCGDLEIETSRRFTRWIATDLSRTGVAELAELDVLVDDDAWRASAADAFHPSGTARMSSSPRTGVVDRDLQVHGVADLFVLGSSAFPTAGYANPTLTIIALAFRLATHIDHIE